VLIAASGLILVLLGLSVAGIVAGGRAAGRILVYAGCLGMAGLLLATALTVLIGGASSATMVLPLGLPWLARRAGGGARC
jgi:hypothetical protein